MRSTRKHLNGCAQATWKHNPLTITEGSFKQKGRAQVWVTKRDQSGQSTQPNLDESDKLLNNHQHNSKYRKINLKIRC